MFPIKVNQQRQVVEEVFEFGKPYQFGLEAGSKPELLAVMALADNDTPIICNGFKDDEYIEMAMHAKKIGRQIIPVVEKFTELDLIIKHAERMGVRPVIGVRVKLASRGSGRWKSSGGYRSKFGLTISEAVRVLETLQALGHGRLPAAAALPPGQPDHEHPPGEGRGQRSDPRLRRAEEGGRGAAVSWTSAAASASTTTARRPTSSRASTTRCRNTRTTSSTTSRTCAMRPKCRTRRSSPRAAARSRRITACWCSTCSAISEFGETEHAAGTA